MLYWRAYLNMVLFPIVIAKYQQFLLCPNTLICTSAFDNRPFFSLGGMLPHFRPCDSDTLWYSREFSPLSSRPCTKESTCGKECRKVLSFAQLLLLYHTSYWLNQQNLPKPQVAVYLFVFNWSTIFRSTKSLLSLNTLVILCGEHWKIGSFYCVCLWLLWFVELNLNTFYFINLLSIGC